MVNVFPPAEVRALSLKPMIPQHVGMSKSPPFVPIEISLLGPSAGGQSLILFVGGPGVGSGLPFVPIDEF